MIAKFLKTAALAAPAFAMFALAQPASASYGTASAAAAATTAANAANAAAKAEPKRYCANITHDTGSRMSRKVCKTKSEWAEEGVEIGSKR